MGKRHQEDMAVGEDAFMDTIANLVGIMIILVVIVAARGYTTAKVQVQAEADSQMRALDTPKNTAVNLDRDLESLVEDLQKYNIELAMRSAERMTMVDRVTLVQKAIEERLQSMDSTTADDVVSNAEMSELEKQLADLLKQSGDLPPTETQPIALQHLPTPMAKTVFGKELHVMMQNNRVTVIPWDMLIETLKQQVQRSVARNTQREKIDDTLGPIDGFMMRYRLNSRSGIMSDGRTAAMGKMVELDKFELEPTADILTESVPDALRPGGRLRAELEATKSQQVTITVWVYPESFGAFRALKERLFTEGFLCAARPLPANMRIGASPRGSSSAAQ
jgi:hypothetical protein